jgi:hypothetical protein
VSISLTANGWRPVAVFEVAAHASAAWRAACDVLVDATDGACRIAPAPESPAGAQWFEVVLDFGAGEWRAMRMFATLVERLESLSLALPGYRLVSGKEWYDVALAQRGGEFPAHVDRASERPARHG